MKPFEKTCNFPKQAKSYQRDTEFVVPFNKNGPSKSPTTSSKTFAPKGNNDYLKMPFKK